MKGSRIKKSKIKRNEIFEFNQNKIISAKHSRKIVNHKYD